MNKIDKELKKINISLLMEHFLCGFIIVDEEDEVTINYLKEQISNSAKFISVCNNTETLNKILTTITKEGEKNILYNLKPIYKLFATKDLNNDGIYSFYQNITESYRDRLWQNNKGQLFFVLTHDEYEQFYYPKDIIEKEKRYIRDNHFRTMVTITIDLTKEVKHKKKIKN